MSHPIFSIVTPTFNSSKYIHRVFESAASQTFRQFEWIVIDDASLDDTLEIVRGYQRSAAFPISIIEKRANRGLLDSYNIGVAAAQGEFFVGMGHDDRFKENSLQFFWDAWNAIPLTDRHRFCSLTVQCCDELGAVAESFPFDGMDSNFLEMYFVHKRRAEQWSIYRTDVLREFPFPSEYRLGEGVFAWFPMAERYQSRFFNVPLRTYYRDNPDSLTNTLNPRKYAKEMLQVSLRMFNFTAKYSRRDIRTLAMHCARYFRFSWHANQSIFDSIKEVKGSLLCIAIIALPLACLMVLYDHVRFLKSKKNAPLIPPPQIGHL